jgi:tRNA(fMet)-specific endonuclease VapC
VALILDTNALSALADGDAALEPVIREAAEVALPVIVLGEYRFGIRQSRNHLRYERWLAGVVPSCRILNVDGATASEYASVRLQLKGSGRPIPSNDLWIAALARQHGLPLISRDQHFDSVLGLRRIHW